VTSLIDLAAGSKVAWVLAAPSDAVIVLATTGGNGLSCVSSDWIGRNRSGKSFLTIEPNDAVLRPVLLGSEAAGNGTLRFACLSSGGRLLTYPVSQVKVLRSGGRGSSLMALEAGEQLAAVEAYGSTGILVRGTGRAGKSVERPMSARELANYEGARGRKGRLLEPRVRDGRLLRNAAASTTPDA
jgi:topoisomerase-4 subunit A